MSLNIEGSLDTNVILRWVLGDVKAQTPKTDHLINSGKLLWVSTLVIAEVVYVLEDKKFTRDEIRSIIEQLSSQLNLYMKRAVIIPAIQLYASHGSISFVDACLVFEAAELHAEPLYTFDKKLANKAKDKIVLL